VLTTAPQGGFGIIFCRFRLVRRYGVPVLNMLSFWTFVAFVCIIAAFFVTAERRCMVGRDMRH